MEIRLWEVGGSIRDELLGFPSKDKDFSVEIVTDAVLTADEGFTIMRDWLVDQGYTIFVNTPEYVTLRAHFPRGHEQFGKTTADFVLCRSEGAYTDGRRPDTVTIGTILDDLSRRDFTCNAIARNVVTGELYDPFHGSEDIAKRRLSCVGSATDRISEDALRAIRALRFQITKRMAWDVDLYRVMHDSSWLPAALGNVSTERISDELKRCFQHDTYYTLDALSYLPPAFRAAIFCRPIAGGRDGNHLWLEPSMSKVKGH